MNEQGVTRPVRFRAVIEMSFPDADPWDPTDYEKLIEQWKEAPEKSSLFNSKTVLIREVLTIAEEEDDYEDWRNRRGRYELPKKTGLWSINGPGQNCIANLSHLAGLVGISYMCLELRSNRATDPRAANRFTFTAEKYQFRTRYLLTNTPIDGLAD
jgi:hypothetical protein